MDAALHNQPNLAFTKAAFIFKDGLSKARTNKKDDKVEVTVKPIEPSTPKPNAPASIAGDAHLARHKRRLRMLRLVQHLLTSILSVSIAVLQGRVYIVYIQTKNVQGAWPTTPNLVPTLMLCITAVAALGIDLCAIVAYFWPQSNIGKRAFMLASSGYGIYTTVKGISYAYSAVVCKTGFDQGNATGDNNDLWSWLCRSKDSTTSAVTLANANCTGSAVSWYLAIANISIEVLGVVVNQIAKQDADKAASSVASADVEMQTSSIDVDSDTRPLLSKSADAGGSDVGQKGPQEKPNDDSSDQFDKWTDELDDQLETLKPKIPGPKSG